MLATASPTSAVLAKGAAGPASGRSGRSHGSTFRRILRSQGRRGQGLARNAADGSGRRVCAATAEMKVLAGVKPVQNTWPSGQILRRL